MTISKKWKTRVWVKYAFIGPILRPAQAMGSMKRLVSLRSISTSRLMHLLSRALLRRRSLWSSRYTSRNTNNRNRSSMSLCASNRCHNLSLRHSRSSSRHLSLSRQRRNQPLRLLRSQSR